MGAFWAKTILGILNSIILLIGILVITIGIWVRLGTEMVDNKTLDDMGVLGTLRKVENFTEYLDTGVWILIGMGVFLTLMGLLGGCGTCCSTNAFLIGYIVIVAVLFILEVAIIGLVFSQNLKDILSKSLHQTMSQYNPPTLTGKVDTSDSASRALDYLFIELKCCGFEDYKDLTKAMQGGKLPITCCKGADALQSLIEEGKPLNSSLPKFKTCVDTLKNSYQDQGCYDALVKMIEDNKPAVIGTGTAILLVEVLCVIMAVFIIRDRNKVDIVNIK